jgi:hypothetical protein
LTRRTASSTTVGSLVARGVADERRRLLVRHGPEALVDSYAEVSVERDTQARILSIDVRGSPRLSVFSP